MQPQECPQLEIRHDQDDNWRKKSDIWNGASTDFFAAARHSFFYVTAGLVLTICKIKKI